MSEVLVEDMGGLVVPEEVVTQQPEPELRKSKRIRTLKNFGPEFQLYLIKETRDEVSDQHSYCFNVDDDPKTCDEAMKSNDVAFWKEAINNEMDSIIARDNIKVNNNDEGTAGHGSVVTDYYDIIVEQAAGCDLCYSSSYYLGSVMLLLARMKKNDNGFEDLLNNMRRSFWNRL
ncbi:hypothetical protein Tco_0912000, partial [Tanacetum coccineum]